MTNPAPRSVRDRAWRIAVSTVVSASSMAAHHEEVLHSEDPSVHAPEKVSRERSPSVAVGDRVGFSKDVAVLRAKKQSERAPDERDPRGVLDPVRYAVEHAGPEMLKLLAGRDREQEVARRGGPADGAIPRKPRGGQVQENLKKGKMDLRRSHLNQRPEAFSHQRRHRS